MTGEPFLARALTGLIRRENEDESICGKREKDQGPSPDAYRERAVTESYKADHEQVTKVLNDVLATEIVCTLRYERHYYMAQGISSDSVKEEFLQHANDEQQHADWIAERITQIGGEPNFNPEGLATRSHSEYKPAKA